MGTFSQIIRDKSGLALMVERMRGILAPTAAEIAFYATDFFEGDRGAIVGSQGTGDFALLAGGVSGTLNNRIGGIRRQVSAATGGAASKYYIDQPVFDTVAGQKTGDVSWGIAFRMKVTGTIEAATEIGCGIGPDPLTMYIGVNGSTSTTKFSFVRNTGSTVALTDDPSIDANWHVFEMYHDGTQFLTRVDLGPLRSHVLTGLYNNYAYIMREIINGATASARTLEVDWLAFAQERAL